MPLNKRPFSSAPPGGSNLHTAPSASNTEADGRRVERGIDAVIDTTPPDEAGEARSQTPPYLRKPLKNEIQDGWLGCLRKPSEELLIRRFRVRFPGGPARQSPCGSPESYSVLFWTASEAKAHVVDEGDRVRIASGVARSSEKPIRVSAARVPSLAWVGSSQDSYGGR